MRYDETNVNVVIRVLEELERERHLRAQAEAQLDAQKGKVLFAEALQADDNSIKVEDLAIKLKQSGVETGKERLYTWLREHGYVYRQPCGQNLPTQKSLALGVMEVKYSASLKTNGKSHMHRTTMITPKGRVYFFDKVMADKERINAIEAEKKAAKVKRDSEARKAKRQANKVG